MLIEYQQRSSESAFGRQRTISLKSLWVPNTLEIILSLPRPIKSIEIFVIELVNSNLISNFGDTFYLAVLFILII